MQRQKISKLHTLNLSYADYQKNGYSIANSRIGRYVVYDMLGKGQFGAVYLGMDDETKMSVAIKVLDLQLVQEEPNPKVRQIKERLCKSQSQLMMQCNSDNIIKCYDVYENRSLKILVIQYCNGGELQQEIIDKGKIPQKQAILILKQLINGLSQMHTHNIIHRDLKSENILSHNGVYKIADLGFSKKVADQAVKQTTLGTITTMAPEVMKRQPYGLKADIWSIGIIFFQMVFGKVPYTSTNANQMYFQIQNKKILDTQQFQFNNYKASKEVTTFLRQVLIIDQNKRLGWKDLIHHPIFKLNEERLDNEFRLNCNLKAPQIKINDQLENNQFKNETVIQIPKFLPEPQVQDQQAVIRMTQAQANNKKKQLKNDQDILYVWVKETHLQCLKTELLYKQIFSCIQKNNLLDLTDRTSIEFMYLILTRCLNNISVIHHRVQLQKGAPLLTRLQQIVKFLYGEITTSWKTYSQRLTDSENKVTSIISDRFLKIFKSKSIEQKDKFLTGIQKMYYSKQEQISFTDNEYIKVIKNQLKLEPLKIVKKLKNYLSHYSEINSIKLSDLKQRTFEEYVEMILQ